MSAYRLVVRRSGKVIRQGTAWLLQSNLVVTAFHVVGVRDMRRWYHEQEGMERATYHLLDVAGGDADLEPVICDLQADIAMLRVERALTGPVLTLAEASAERDTRWHAQGYPELCNGEQVTLLGRVAESRRGKPNKSIQLIVDVNADAAFSWRGISGAAVCVDDRVIGIMTNESGHISIGWAASGEAIRRLKRIYDASDLVKTCQKILLSVCADMRSLLDLYYALEFPLPQATSAAAESAQLETVVGKLVYYSVREGVDGLVRLLDEIEGKRPASLEVKSLRSQILARAGQRGGGFASRAEQVMHAMQHLRLEGSECIGLAVFEAYGFHARQVIYGEVVPALRATNGSFWPVSLLHLRTESEDPSDAYLLRQLLRELPEGWRGYIDDRKEEKFERAVELLLDGPARDAGRKLLFVFDIDILSRASAEQLKRWNILIDGFSHQGLKVLIWGGQELHDFYTEPQSSGRFPVLHRLRDIWLGPLSGEEVARLVTNRGGYKEVAEVLYEETEGHPALVHDLINRFWDDVCVGNREELTERAYQSLPIVRLRKEVEINSVARELLRFFANVNSGLLPRGQRSGEERLRLLGILREKNGAKNWDWTAPVMRRFAEDWK